MCSLCDANESLFDPNNFPGVIARFQNNCNAVYHYENVYELVIFSSNFLLIDNNSLVSTMGEKSLSRGKNAVETG